MHKHPKDHPFLCIYKMIFIAFLLSNLEGCATGVLHTALDNPTSLPFKELQFLNDKKEVGVADMQKELVGEYEGDIIFKDTKYSRFIIRGVRGNCDEKLPVELLLPGNKKSDLKPILRDLTVKKMSPEQTARIVLFHKNIKMDMVDHFLPSNIWREYSTVLVILLRHIILQRFER